MGGHLRAFILEQVHLLFTVQTAVVHMRADAVNSVAQRRKRADVILA